ncbi:unnamed protein product [Rotaria sp. Silwood2]|nr:unnamed protein product [Rotaria sp. Silwood2]CAF3217311.1 unnamed protein product [Rotaria sp. Silwood2]CAF4394038.1 unnamed protein product [Rotaria sp. Silwood2]CAF4484036.1 unnamed protein product [Rotaria sp. Silwood2]
MLQLQRKKLKKNSPTKIDQDNLCYQLSSDVIVKILSYLQDVSDLGCCLFISKLWNLAASQPSLWKKFVKEEFGDYFNHDDNCNWLQFYKRFHELNIQENL